MHPPRKTYSESEALPPSSGYRLNYKRAFYGETLPILAPPSLTWFPNTTAVQTQSSRVVVQPGISIQPHLGSLGFLGEQVQKAWLHQDYNL